MSNREISAMTAGQAARIKKDVQDALVRRYGKYLGDSKEYLSGPEQIQALAKYCKGRGYQGDTKEQLLGALGSKA